MGLLLVLGFCLIFYVNKRIEGVWIRHYWTDLKDQDFRYDGEVLLSIHNQEFNTYGFSRTPLKMNYFDFGKTLKTWPSSIENSSSFTINSVNKDSLVIQQYDSDKNYKIIYKKISDSLKNNSDWNRKLIGKAFEFRLPEYTDTIYFDDRFIMSKNQLSPNRDWDSQGWDLLKVKGYDIMFTGNWTTFVLKENNRTIKFYGFDNKRRLSQAELTEIDIDLSKVKRIVERIKRQYPQ